MAQTTSDLGRRNFINWLLGGALVGWLGSILYPLIRYLIPPEIPEAKLTTLKIGKASEIVPNSAVMFRYGRKPGLLIRSQQGDFSAFDATCTHLDCTVQYRADWGVIWCACHNGRYDLTGRNISGPPPRPLSPFVVNLQEGDVYVSETTS